MATPGGKFTKEKKLTVPTPDEDGFSDLQVAWALIIALVGLYWALDLAKALYEGEQPSKWEKNRYGGGPFAVVTPFTKRTMENE